MAADVFLKGGLMLRELSVDRSCSAKPDYFRKPQPMPPVRAVSPRADGVCGERIDLALQEFIPN